MKLVALLLKTSRGLVALAILSAILSGAANTGLLALLTRAVTRFDEPGSRPVALFFGFCLFAFLLRVWAENTLIRLGQNIILDLRLELCRRILRVKLRRLEELGPHRILSTLTADIPSITDGIMLLPLLSFSASVVLTSFAYLVILSPKVFLASLAFLVAGILAYQLPVLRATRYFRAARLLNDRLYDHFEALTHGLKELKLHRERRQAFLNQALESTATDYRDRTLRAFRLFIVAASTGQLLAFVVLGLLVLVLPSVMAVESTTMVGFVLVFLYVLSPLQQMMNSVPTFNQAGVALERIDQMGLDLSQTQWLDPEEVDQAPADLAGWQRLELHGVTHAYHREGEQHDFVLGPLDLEIRAGELVFLVGGNGSGKTTLAKVLLGLYEPESGEIRLDGEVMRGERLESYRQLFTAVFSDFRLFEELLGLEAPELDERARRYLEKLELDHKVTVKDGVLSSTGLSQGQRKRLALLTAYLEDRPIYLFDEWAADQDPTFKAVFYHALLPELKRRGKTVVVISHDEAYFDVADRVLRLDDGKLTSEEALPVGS